MSTTVAGYPTSLYTIKPQNTSTCTFTLCCDERPHSGTALYTERISAQPPVRDYPALTIVINQEIYRTTAQHALHHLCLVSEPTILYIFSLMSARCNLRSHSPLKTVLNRLGDIYQAYCNTYKTHTMATYHRGTGQPLDRDDTPNGKDTDVNIPHDYHHKDTGVFENI